MKIDFEFDTSYGKFRDAIWLPDDHTLTPEEITAMQTERLNSWLYSIENPVVQETDIVELEGNFYKKVDIGGEIFFKPVGD